MMDSVKYNEMVDRFNEFITSLPEDVSDELLTGAVELKGFFIDLYGDE